MSNHYDGNLEFLNFLADISDPGTGQIVREKLASWLGFSDQELLQRWHQSGRRDWGDYADDVLRVLDRMHDQTYSLARTLNWYCNQPVDRRAGLTGDQLVSTGRACEALQRLRDKAERPMCQIPSAKQERGAQSHTGSNSPRSRPS